MTRTTFSDPEYTLRWPPALFAEEAQRLVQRAGQFGNGPQWREEVETLLRQAFSSQVPLEDFRQLAASTQWQLGEEPF